MRYISAYVLATLGGNKNPSEADISKILSSVGIEVESENVKKVISELKGKNIDEVIARGSTKLASVPSGGAVVASSAAPAAAAGGGGAAKAEEAKKEEKKEESEEEDEDMGFGLFD